jgi:DNA repair protein RadC
MKEQNLTIRDLLRIERPREKLLKYGAGRLSVVELLATLLGTGRKGESVLLVARKLLKAISFEKLSSLAPNEFRNISGIGPAKTCTLLASIELGKRLFQNKKVAIA